MFFGELKPICCHLSHIQPWRLWFGKIMCASAVSLFSEVFHQCQSFLIKTVAKKTCKTCWLSNCSNNNNNKHTWLSISRYQIKALDRDQGQKTWLGHPYFKYHSWYQPQKSSVSWYNSEMLKYIYKHESPEDSLGNVPREGWQHRNHAKGSHSL